MRYALIELNDKALRRRAKELRDAASQPVDTDSRALLLFYAAECGLKSLYMQRHRLKTTSSENALARSAASFRHRLDDLIVALRIPARTLGHHPGTIRLRTGDPLAIASLHEVWRYGGALDTPAPAVTWLERVVDHVVKELR